jgi:predicted ribosome quality control (RQC) complex YloA/Tae2 family protein
MGNQLSRDQLNANESERVISFSPAPKNGGSHEADQLDTAGQTILRLLHKAAGVADANSQHALDIAQKLSHELRAADDKIAELEAEVRTFQDRAERAEEWLHKIYTEVEERFIRRPEEKRRAVQGSFARRG